MYRHLSTPRAALLAALLAAVASAQEVPRGEWEAPALTSKTYRTWLQYILPGEEETRWEKMHWRTKLWDAVLEARELDRPILLWTMNGHPCAVT